MKTFEAYRQIKKGFKETVNECSEIKLISGLQAIEPVEMKEWRKRFEK